MKRITLLLLGFVFIISCKKGVNTVNSGPISNAGRDNNVLIGQTYQLDGSESFDADLDSLSFKWTIKDEPDRSNAKLNKPSDSHPLFTPDTEGEYIIQLIVNDGHTDSKPSEVVINAIHQKENAVPIAHAGTDRNINLGTTVTLNGNESTDANGHNLSYKWAIKDKPNGSNAKLDNPSDSHPLFTPDTEGEYIIQLVVNDGHIDSKPDEIRVTVTKSENKKSELMTLGLDEADAQYLLDKYPEDVNFVLSNKNRIFKDLPILDNNMFALPTDPDARPFNSFNLMNWNAEYIKEFKKMFGRIAFVLNSPKFIDAFNKNINNLNPAYQGNTDPNSAFPDTPFPRNYAEFRDAANNAIQKYHNKYEFFVSAGKTGVAHGMVGLKLEVENNMFGPQNEGAPHNAESLIAHELTHTWGYNHVAPAGRDNEYILKPNNIPYYVQAILGTSYINPNAKMVYGTPEALLTVYFGN